MVKSYLSWALGECPSLPVLPSPPWGHVVSASAMDVIDSDNLMSLQHSALRKTSRILQALSKLSDFPSTPAPITYFALDLEKSELERTLVQLATSDVGKDLKGKVDIKGLCATYDSGLKYVGEGGLRVNYVPDFSSSGYAKFGNAR